ncbi:RES domain-containing protein [Parashewanella spongiae]|uniref:RES domain-containing protein n=1 Tax=Parashewanella spongiae TaxID=342950 RepID=A0A3A6UHL8_9GAMM|nr:RES family NAD+ phosphorylase [Parashewanella spongiae]MCL1077286.1 RES family NAD+ phosphorylase [Parashewanella spongiae]RJY18534.1 RES domain-containing protein [Parashewanella spongiae]
MPLTKLYRLTNKQFSKTPFSVIGAEKFGGRWNSQCIPALYLSSSESLAILDVLAHTEGCLSIRNQYELYEVHIPTNLIMTLADEDYPDDWRSLTVNAATQQIGDQFLTETDNGVIALEVKSTISPRDQNFLLKIDHKEVQRHLGNAKRIDFQFDERILKGLI